MTSITNSEIVTYLSDGFTLEEIAVKTGISKHTLRSKIKVIKTVTNCTTYAHIVAQYLRKKIIE